MMSLLDYANDVGKSLEEIMALCDRLGIEYTDEESLLDDVSITILDNSLEDLTEEETLNTEEQEERRLEEEVEDKA